MTLHINEAEVRRVLTMPQTLEAISHALAANVPIIIALNKVDRADANPERIRQQLAIAIDQ